MNKPFKLSYANIGWSHNAAHLTAWRTGRTGYPLVDAAMRQLQHTGWMHNRCRMITASFLAKHLLLDWRLGEQHFLAHLVDGDFASNNGGWGWSVGAGVDPQPWFRIFNPDRQAERFDPLGVYVRTWIPELRHVGLAAGHAGRGEGERKETKVKTGKLDPIHDPYNLGLAVEAERAGYPRRIVEHKAAREECLRRYKEGLGIKTAEG
jgi:deoxyribodipyrimidine photo-lyase